MSSNWEGMLKPKPNSWKQTFFATIEEKLTKTDKLGVDYYILKLKGTKREQNIFVFPSDYYDLNELIEGESYTFVVKKSENRKGNLLFGFSRVRVLVNDPNKVLAKQGENKN